MLLSFGKIFLVAITLSVACWANADLVSRDLYEPGDGLLTYDEENQREWLILGAFDEINVLLESIATGGVFEGFQFAREEDLYGFLFGVIEVDMMDWLADPSPERTPIQVLEFLGWNFEATGSFLGTVQFASGLIQTDEGDIHVGDHHFDGTTIVVGTFGEELVPGALHSSELERRSSGRIEYLETPFIFPDGTPWLTFWMYREVEIATVPEPSSFSIALLACLAFSAYSPRSNTP